MSSEENLSRVYTINLGRAWITPQYKRTDRVVNMIREFAQKHMKSEDIKLDQDLNRQIWSRGKTNPPRKIRVKMVKDEDGIVTVSGYDDMVSEKEKEKEVEKTPSTAPTIEEKVEAPGAEQKAETKQEAKPAESTENKAPAELPAAEEKAKAAKPELAAETKQQQKKKKGSK